MATPPPKWSSNICASLPIVSAEEEEEKSPPSFSLWWWWCGDISSLRRKRRRGLLIMTLLHSLFSSLYISGAGAEAAGGDKCHTRTRFPEYGGAGRKTKKSRASPFFWSGGSVIMSTVCLLPPLPIFLLSDDGDIHTRTSKWAACPKTPPAHTAIHLG